MCVHRPVEVSVPATAGLCGAGVSLGVDRSVRLPLPQYHSHTIRRAAASVGRPVYHGDCMLFPCGRVFVTRNIQPARGDGLFTGLVLVFGSGLVSAADHGCHALHMGREEPPPKLHSNDSLQGCLGNRGLTIESPKGLSALTESTQPCSLQRLLLPLTKLKL